ncbi:MAG: hypothetical protein AAF703_10265 [Cyanobacteria bacterium P01_D01_bin.105]
MGDRACYIELETPLGTTPQFASFDICQIDNLVGASVRLIYETGTVLAFFHAGDKALKTNHA